jgi:hypothetical protein
MTTLKKTDREEVLRAVLTETFKPRFEDIRRRVEIDLRAHLAKTHPKFVALFKDPEAAVYLATTYVSRVTMVVGDSKSTMRMPIYGCAASRPSSTYLHSGEREKYSNISARDVLTPITVSDFDVTDAKIIKAYADAWLDYTAAQEKLVAVLRSYTTAEKFVADFPEFEKFLPEPPVKAQPPAVIVKDVRRDLKKLGIPA